MSVKRLNQIEEIIQAGTKRGSSVVYELNDITELLNLLDKEKSKQDRKLYYSAYYAQNKEKMDARSKKNYAMRKQMLQEEQQ